MQCLQRFHSKDVSTGFNGLHNERERSMMAARPSPRSASAPPLMSKKERERANKAREALPKSMSRNALFRLWLSARRRNPDAQTELHRLLTAHPKIQHLLKVFVDEHKSIVTAKLRKANAPAAKTAPTAWERMSGRATQWVSVISGGLPSLGKRR
jgi:hypothetical protein